MYGQTEFVDNRDSGLKELYGVWANENTEYVRTNLFSILFERNENEISSVLKGMEVKNDTLYYQTISIVRFNCTSEKVDYEIFPSNSTIAIPLLEYNENTQETLVESGKLKLQTLNGIQELIKIENIETVAPYNMVVATKENIEF